MSTRPRLWAVVALVVSGALLSVSGTAFAYFSATGTGSGRSAAQSLPVPSNLTATCSSLLGSIDVAWTAAEAAPLVATFLVERSPDLGHSWSSIGTITASASTSYTTSDTGLKAATYIYRVTAQHGGWKRQSAGNSNSLTILIDILGVTTCT